MKNIMTRAWEIAREGQEKFGGKVSEYLSESLKSAWIESKEYQEIFERKLIRLESTLNKYNKLMAEIRDAGGKADDANIEELLNIATPKNIENAITGIKTRVGEANIYAQQLREKKMAI